jgi:superfamily II DNA or RNA helicase
MLEAVRKAALPALFSQGVKLAREGAVVVVARSSSEITARVRGEGSSVAPTVTLYLEDEEWTCDCPSKVDPCAHVAAVAIAVAQGTAREEAPAPSGDEPAARAETAVGYRLRTQGVTLLLDRVTVGPRGEARLEGSLASRLGRPGDDLMPTHDDLAVDRLVSGFVRGVVATAKMKPLLAALAGADVKLDGAPVRTSGELLAPRATVRDGASGGVVVRVERSPSLERVVACGVGLADGTLRPLGATELTGERLERLPLERVVDKRELSTFVTDALAKLESQADVAVETSRLPGRGARLAPRLAFELEPMGASLAVLATIVYGDPPVARVDGATLTHLGGKAVPRDLAAENALAERLRDALDLAVGRRALFAPSDVPRFAAKLRAFEAGSGGAARSLATAPELVARLELDGGRFDVVFEAGSGGAARRARSAEVIAAWQRGLDIAPLEGGGWAPIPEGWLAKFGHTVADLLAAREDDGRLARAALPTLGALASELDVAPPPDVAALLERLSRPGDDAPPAGFSADLRPYQREGVRWLARLRDLELGGVLADDMGLGKTVQALAALRAPALVVAPRSVVFNWQREIAKFVPGLRVSTYLGEGRALDDSADVTLTTYGTLRNDAAALASRAWEVVVLDEAQAIKNPDSLTARAAFGLQGKFKLALSGTPVENRLADLFSLMHFANRGLFAGRASFRERFEDPIARGDADAARRLRDRVAPYVLRRKKRDVAPDLPPRSETVLWVELDAAERAAYDAVRVATQKELVDSLAEGMSTLAALEALLRLRQAACHRGLLPGQVAETSSKVERLAHAVEEAAADEHKSLVFSQWTTLLDRIEPALTARGIPFVRLDGTTRDRAAVVDAFQAAGGPPVMLLSLKAGGTGLNLTAADHVFLVDPWWNPAVEDQAADRAHRIGQDKPVLVSRLVAQGTVEERVLALKDAKRALADAAIGGAGAASAAPLSRSEILALLE